jgi:hypothetical protein
MRNGVRNIVRYPLGWFVPVVTIGVFFLSILSAFPSQSVDPVLKANVYSGYMTWLLYLSMCQSTAGNVAGRAAMGILEREFVSPLGHLRITCAGILAEELLATPFYFLIGSVLAMIAFDSALIMVKAVFLVIIPLLFLFGMALGFAALDLLWKRTDVIFQPLQFLMMILAFFSTSSDLAIWRWIPFTAYSRNLKWSLLNSGFCADYADPRPIAVAVMALLAGMWFFTFCDKKVLCDGTMGHY